MLAYVNLVILTRIVKQVNFSYLFYVKAKLRQCARLLPLSALAFQAQWSVRSPFTSEVVALILSENVLGTNFLFQFEPVIRSPDDKELKYFQLFFVRRCG